MLVLDSRILYCIQTCVHIRQAVHERTEFTFPDESHWGRVSTFTCFSSDQIFVPKPVDKNSVEYRESNNFLGVGGMLS